MENHQYASVLESPIGKISILADDAVVHTVTFGERKLTGLQENALTQQALNELKAYFEGQLLSFTFALGQQGTPFQQVVWEALRSINYGDTISYLKFSEQLNNPLAIRAIAAANGKNNIAIVVPCHRVIGSNGKLVGYAGELWRKQWLLEHEKEVSGKGQMMLKF